MNWKETISQIYPVMITARLNEAFDKIFQGSFSGLNKNFISKIE